VRGCCLEKNVTSSGVSEHLQGTACFSNGGPTKGAEILTSRSKWPAKQTVQWTNDRPKLTFEPSFGRKCETEHQRTHLWMYHVNDLCGGCADVQGKTRRQRSCRIEQVSPRQRATGYSYRIIEGKCDPSCQLHRSRPYHDFT
jgi:hypothetical protein